MTGLPFARGASFYTRDDEFVPASFIERELVVADGLGHGMPKWDEVIDELLSARRLDDDWDGQGAKAPTPATVDTALRLVIALRGRFVPPPDDFGPGVGGTILLGWHSGPGSMVIEVLSSLRIEGHRWTKADEKAKRFILLTGE